MKLISCNSCCIVIDADKVQWPDTDDEEYYCGKGREWDGDRYVAWIACPVCKGRIKEDTGE